MLYDFGPRLLRLRREKRLTQQEIVLRAKAMDPHLHLTDSVLGKYENDRTVPRLAEAAAIADVLGVSLDYLATGEKSQLLSVRGLTDEQIEFLVMLTEKLRKLNCEDPSFSVASGSISNQAEWIARIIVQFGKKPL